MTPLSRAKKLSASRLLLGAVLAAAPAVSADTPGPPGRVEAATGGICSVGSFRTERAVGGFDVHFTNLSPRPCARVSYYCLWGMLGSTGFYQQSEAGVHEGPIGAGQTVRVAEVRPRGGPADRDVVWSWCTIR